MGGMGSSQCFYPLRAEALHVPLQADFSVRESSYHFCQLPLTHQTTFPSHSSSKTPCRSGLHVALKGRPPGLGVNPGQNPAHKNPKPHFRSVQIPSLNKRRWQEMGVLNQYKMIEAARLSSETVESTHKSPTATSRLANN